MASNPYDILGVDRDASAAEIKRAYHRLAHRTHPDKHSGDAGRAPAFAEVAEAYAVLGDAGRRAHYDRFGARTFGELPFDPSRLADQVRDTLQDVLKGIFAGDANKQGGRRGVEQQVDVDVSLLQIYHGCVLTVPVRRPHTCQTCLGRGELPGKSQPACAACGGRGTLQLQRGLFWLKKTCRTCRGRGKADSPPCGNCDGTGHCEQNDRLEITLPPGIPDRFEISCGPGADSTRGPRDTVVVVCHEVPHPVLRRHGRDVQVTLVLSPSEAALGVSLRLPGLGSEPKVHVPPGTQPGTRLRLAGRGLPDCQHPGQRGDQFVAVEVEIPRHLVPEQEGLYRTLAAHDAAYCLPQRAACRAAIQD